jgi:hypothetical protein
MPLQLISRCSIRKDAERTKGENGQQAKHGHIFPKAPTDNGAKMGKFPGIATSPTARPFAPAGFSVYAGQNTLAAVDGKATGR